MNLETLVRNANRTGHGSHTVATAAAALGIEGVESLCCWCLDSSDPAQLRQAFRLNTERSDCDACSMVGRDVLVVGPAPRA